MNAIFALLAFVVSTQAIPISKAALEKFQTFKLEYKKHYQNEHEERFRLEIFNKNFEMIIKHNQRYEAGEVSYKMGLNEYSDLLPQEFKKLKNGYNYALHKSLRASSDNFIGKIFISPAEDDVPDTIDWLAKGAVTHVKNQKECGSCWAFATTGSLEGQHFRKTGELISLSEQNLIDCSTNWGNFGCKNGLMVYSYEYIKDNGGINTEESYPYKGIDDSCHFNNNTIGATTRGFVEIPQGDEKKLKEAVATVGPIAVIIAASPPSFIQYIGGLYDYPDCSSWSLNHAVLVVGYGTTDDGQDYWLVKNSWGDNWGEKGYAKMSRNKNNQCGIATMASYPLI